ncbi:MAG TPA: hypothetical protein VGI68_13905 [Mycobacterium sp.]|jgi:hypothetical protein
MTTHDQHTEMTGYDESQAAGAPSTSENPAPAVSADAPSAAASSAATPAAQAPNQSAPPLAPAQSSTASGGPAPTDADARATAGNSNVKDESATEELLFADDDLAELRARWAGVQAAFVDDPKECVQKADVLVSDLVEQLTTGFAHARSRLEEQWERGEEASTEELRVALMHYREFFERLLAV